MGKQNTSLSPLNKQIIELIESQPSGISAEDIAKNLNTSKAVVIKQISIIQKSKLADLDIKGSVSPIYKLNTPEKKGAKSKPKTKKTRANTKDYMIALKLVNLLETNSSLDRDDIISNFSDSGISEAKIDNILSDLIKHKAIEEMPVLNESLFKSKVSDPESELSKIYNFSDDDVQSTSKQETSTNNSTKPKTGPGKQTSGIPSPAKIEEICFSAISKGSRKVVDILNHAAKKAKGISRHHVTTAIESLLEKGEIEEFTANKLPEYLPKKKSPELVSPANIKKVKSLYGLNTIETLTLEAISKNNSIVTDILSYLKSQGEETSRHFVDKALIKLLSDKLIKRVIYGKRHQYRLLTKEEIELHDEIEGVISNSDAAETELQRKIILFEHKCNNSRPEHEVIKDIVSSFLDDAISRL